MATLRDVGQGPHLRQRCSVGYVPLETWFTLARIDADVILGITRNLGDDSPCSKTKFSCTWWLGAKSQVNLLHTILLEALDPDGELSHFVSIGINIGKHFFSVICQSPLCEQFVTRHWYWNKRGNGPLDSRRFSFSSISTHIFACVRYSAYMRYKGHNAHSMMV